MDIQNQPAPRLLLIDDDLLVRSMAAESLLAAGFEVAEAGDGASGLARAEQSPPDLVLLDLGLPDLDGVEVTRRIREWSAVPIVVLSVRGGEFDHANSWLPNAEQTRAQGIKGRQIAFDFRKVVVDRQHAGIVVQHFHRLAAKRFGLVAHLAEAAAVGRGEMVVLMAMVAIAGVIILVLHPQAVALQADAFGAQGEAAKKEAFEALFRVLMPIRILYGVTLVLGVVLMGIKTKRSLTVGGAPV